MSSARPLQALGRHDDLRESLAEERVRLLRDGLVNYLGYICAGLSGLILVPVLIGSLSRELYGIWIAGLALEYSLSFLNAGLGRGIAREVAADSDAAMPFVMLAMNLYGLLGLAGVLVIGVTGLPLSHGLHVSPGNLRIAQITFLLIGTAFLGEQILSAGMEILTGLRRFPAINALLTASVILRTVGIIILASKTGSLVAIASWHAFISIVSGIFGLLLAIRCYPRFRFRVALLTWRHIRPQLEFSALSQVAAACSNLLWRFASLVIGLRFGSSAIVAYEIGQKFPMYVSSLSWQAAEALLPAASEYHSARRQAHTVHLIQIGTRGLLILALPLAVILFVIAPQLVIVWTRTELPGASLILRVMVIAVLADIAAAASIQTLWAQGKMKILVALGVLALAIAAALVWPLFAALGVAGAPVALAIAVLVTSPLYGLAVSRACECSLFRLWWPAVRDLWMPTLICAVCVTAGTKLVPYVSWVSLFLIASAAGVAYVGFFYALGAQEEERRLLYQAVNGLSGSPRSLYRSMRRALGRIRAVRWLYFSMLEIRDYLLDSSTRDRRYLMSFYSQPDPFGFSRELEQFRFQRAIGMLDEAANGRRFARAFEVGCAEGMFTEMLAPRCDSLVAVDLVDIPLARARQRCRDFGNVEFAVWDSRSGKLSGEFDLIVATGVLEYIHRPSTLKRTCDTLARALRPGGYLMVGNTVADNNIERTWLGKRLIRGTLINEYLGHDPRLEVVSASLDQCVCPFAHLLLRKRPQ